MSDDDPGQQAWLCPKCGGGFPKPYVVRQESVCPWCGKQIAKMFCASEAQRKRLQRWYDVA